MTPEVPSQVEQLAALQRRVEELEAKLVTRPSFFARHRRVVLGLAACLGLIGAGTVYAANGNCPNGYPACFVADQPALASQVNLDFAQIKEWVETKIGAVTAAGVTTTTLTVNGNANVNNALLNINNSRIVGTNGSGNFHLDTTGNAMYLNWYSGPGGFVFGNGAQGQAARIDTGGSMQLAGNLSIAGTGGNTPHGCVVRQATNSYNAACAGGEIAVGGGGRCASLWRLTESIPWGGPNDGDATVVGGVPTAWRSVCQVWGNAGTYTYPQMGAYAVCCRY